MKKNRIIFIIIFSAFIAAGFSGCGRVERAPADVGDMEFSRSAPAPSTANEASPAAGVSLPQAQTQAARMIIKTAALEIKVRDVEAAFTRAVQLAEGSGGYVQSSTRSVVAGDRADLTIKVPPDGFLPLIKSLEELGSAQSKSISGQDVTEEYYDLEGELENLLQVRGRLFELLSQAKRVDDAILVEEQLERIGANVNRVKGRMKYLQTMTGLSTIDLTLASEARPAAEAFLNWSFIGNGFVVAARALVRIFFFILQALVVIIPLGIVVGAAAWGVIRLLRARKVSRGAAKPSGRR
jgi:hypothetical protein